jgi:hypothetical protein
MGMGPPPKPPGERVRRNATIAMTKLPAEGRSKAAPPWPLIPDVIMTAKRNIAAAKVDAMQYERRELLDAGRATGTLDRKIDIALETMTVLDAQLSAQRELETTLWADLWKLPQAVQWERLGWLRDVAQYVRFKVLAELGDLDSAKEARQWSDRLGLTPLAMLRLRWEVVTDEVAAKRKQRAKPSSARGRLKAVG